MAKRKPNSVISQLAAAIPDFDFINRWTFHLSPADIILLVTLADNKAVNFAKLDDHAVNHNAWYVHMTRLRKRLPRGVTIINEWGGVYSLSPKSKEILKKYERK